MARENPVGVTIGLLVRFPTSDTTFRTNRLAIFLRSHGIPPAPKRSANTTWKDFIAAHMAVLAGVDFFTVEVLTWRGPVTYYVLFFLHLETRRVSLAGITRHPSQEWMEQVARNAVDEVSGHARHIRYVLHDRDTKFCVSFRKILATGNITCLALPPRSPNLNAFCGTLGTIREARVLIEADPIW